MRHKAETMAHAYCTGPIATEPLTVLHFMSSSVWEPLLCLQSVETWLSKTTGKEHGDNGAQWKLTVLTHIG